MRRAVMSCSQDDDQPGILVLFPFRTRGRSTSLRFTPTPARPSATTVALCSTASYTRAWDVNVWAPVWPCTLTLNDITEKVWWDPPYLSLSLYVPLQTVWWTSISAAWPTCPACVGQTTQRGEVACTSPLRSRLTSSLLPVSWGFFWSQTLHQPTQFSAQRCKHSPGSEYQSNVSLCWWKYGWNFGLIFNWITTEFRYNFDMFVSLFVFNFFWWSLFLVTQDVTPRSLKIQFWYLLTHKGEVWNWKTSSIATKNKPMRKNNGVAIHYKICWKVLWKSIELYSPHFKKTFLFIYLLQIHW